MTNQFYGHEPAEDASGATDPALDALLVTWRAGAAEPIDVEGALAQVKARRSDERLNSHDDLAARRAERAVVRSTPWKAPAFRIAAALVAVIGGTLLWRSTRSAVREQTYATTVGATRAFTLMDGTQVRLGPASSIELADGFGGAHRRLRLHGEAWFKVTHDEAKPFAIQVGAATVEDVGTAFLVREADSTEVSVRVSEGEVRVTRAIGSGGAQRDSIVTLHAGDGAVATAAGIHFAAGVVTAAEGVALAAGHLTFTDASLHEVRDALHRWYGVSLVINDASVATRHLTADFTGEPLARVAAVLGLTLGVDATQRGDTIVLERMPEVPSRP
jgi:transmembrane sensor